MSSKEQINFYYRRGLVAQTEEFCKTTKIDANRISSEQLLRLAETIRYGRLTRSDIIKNVMNCNNLIQMQQKYKQL